MVGFLTVCVAAFAVSRWRDAGRHRPPVTRWERIWSLKGARRWAFLSGLFRTFGSYCSAAEARPFSGRVRRIPPPPHLIAAMSVRPGWAALRRIWFGLVSEHRGLPRLGSAIGKPDEASWGEGEVVSEGGRDNRGDPSKRFWGFFMVFWIALGVVSLIFGSWWTVATSVGGTLFTAMQRRNAPDKPR